VARDNGQGMFSMEFITEVSTMKDLVAAKAKVQQHIDESKATDPNKQAATMMVYNSRALKNLVIGMSNFSLAHMGLRAK
jgi:hypothetical protein